ncbi:MAG: hypothetical protein HFI56_05455 [Lachnospiraceae bacterium]|jgi:hypothetical protein|nr:hypothetical protein [Lachnospiraceae bacterium]MCI9397719.1 hypothetical protein [Lachnospiraceae bacterium]
MSMEKCQKKSTFLKMRRIRRKGLTSFGIYGKILLKTRALDEERDVPRYGGMG